MFVKMAAYNRCPSSGQESENATLPRSSIEVLLFLLAFKLEHSSTPRFVDGRRVLSSQW